MCVAVYIYKACGHVSLIPQVRATLASLLQDDFSDTTDPSLVDNAWRGAEVSRIRDGFNT